MELLPSSKRRLLRNRERNLCKKADELSILCGTDVCMIIFKPHKTKPETWPQNSTEVHRIMRKYKAKLSMKNNDVKDTRSPASMAIRDATEAAAATTTTTTTTQEQDKMIKLDFNLSDSYESDSKGKRLHAYCNTMNSEEARNMELQYQGGTAKHSNNELIADDEAKLASLEAKLQDITKIIAIKEATHASI